MLNSLPKFIRTVKLGVRSLFLHKLRSSLTVLGIVFGVCSVISMLSIGEGASREVLEQYRRLGSNNIIVKSVEPPRDGAQSSRRRMGPPSASEYGLRYADAEQLAQVLPTVEVMVPIKSIATTVRYKATAIEANVIGTVPWFTRTANLEVDQGRFLSLLDMRRYANVCVISTDLARRLFQFREPVGESLRIGRNAYRVVGIVREATSVVGEGVPDLPSQGANLFVPLTTLRAYEGDLYFEINGSSTKSEYVELHQLTLTVKSDDQVEPTATIVEDILRRNHDDQDFQLIVPRQLLRQARRTQAIFSAVLGSIAAISLLVGGIGIMNIMLATVSERTQEIGIRRALGARRRDIMQQFLVECVILSLGGGVIGMALGAGIPWMVTRFSGMPTVLTPWAFLLSFSVSALIGIVFGLYPARRAALMDPIEALRHE